MRVVMHYLNPNGDSVLHFDHPNRYRGTDDSRQEYIDLFRTTIEKWVEQVGCAGEIFIAEQSTFVRFSNPDDALICIMRFR